MDLRACTAIYLHRSNVDIMSIFIFCILNYKKKDIDIKHVCNFQNLGQHISRNWRSKGLRGIRSLRNTMSIENVWTHSQLTAEKSQILTSCSRICNVGTS